MNSHVALFLIAFGGFFIDFGFRGMIEDYKNRKCKQKNSEAQNDNT